MSLSFGQFVAIEWLLLVICLIIIVTRLIIRSTRILLVFWLSELFLVAAFFAYLPLVVGDTYTFASGQALQNSSYNESLAKWTFASTLIFDLGFYLARFSLLAFYHELFPISETRLRILLWLVVAFNVAGFLVTGFIDLFWCGANISLNWSETESECSASADPMTARIIWPINVASELLVFLLPFTILKRLNKLERKERLSLICIFFLGFATILASVSRFTLGVVELFSLEAYLLGSVETATQIIVVALPALRPLLAIISRKRANHSGQNISEPSHGSSSQGQKTQKFSQASTSVHTGNGSQSQVHTTLSVDREYIQLRDHSGRPPWEDIELPQYLGGK